METINGLSLPVIAGIAAAIGYFGIQGASTTSTLAQKQQMASAAIGGLSAYLLVSSAGQSNLIGLVAGGAIGAFGGPFAISS